MNGITTRAQWLKKLPPWAYKLGAQAWIDKTFPRHLFIETTASCNLSCSYCPRERRKDHMEWSTFQSIVDEATRYGSRSFSTHLFGEPLLYPKWKEAIEYIHSKNKHHTVLLTTNGTQLNREVDRLIGANPDQVLWSWRPEAVFTPETKEKLRKWAKFRVRFIEEVTPKEAYEEWADWPNVEGRKLHNYGGNIKTSLFKNISTEDSGLRTQPLIRTQDGQKITSSTHSDRWPCYHLWLAPAVAWNGNILLCCADPHQKEVLGTFPKQTVAEVWQGDRLKAIRDGHLKGEYKGICEGCDVWKQYPDIFFKRQKGGSS